MRHALLFAAGLGERMRPLTGRTPKPLLPAGGKPLIAWHLEKLAAAGVRYVVINTSHLAEQFPDTLGDGARWGLRIRYAYEGPQPLETGGGMRNALPLLGAEPFLAISADIWSDYDYAALPAEPAGLAHLVMVPNPAWHAGGDFALGADGRLREDGPGQRLTFGNIGVYRPQLVRDEPPGRFKLLPCFQRAMREGLLHGERYDGRWHNVGTPRQLAELDAELARRGAA
ncbi:N-acetylmuramate alpha-1-phosphate uridylyltransferase MurU [Fulvimonas soli]|uniref:MurNAc alpha-1-phosphate uridylyltransferase n=1 Tax=Fulvimonas soli TaxID=155197 RepID=A0A316IY81_9GAMM|nr:nucleotidyltransferase family protein [Fulvimonas soli]PWK92145.1 MurNAc alpha-1-phosphate uridylyltransferase [Fulvimonas soli]TNY27867.1 mannose-1-phosphate guanylyltransferase [Fulvimonas soli]